MLNRSTFSLDTDVVQHCRYTGGNVIGMHTKYLQFLFSMQIILILQCKFITFAMKLKKTKGVPKMGLVIVN